MRTDQILDLDLEIQRSQFTGTKLFSKRAIFWLSFLCSSLLGMVLLSINLNKLKKNILVIYVIAITLFFVAVDYGIFPPHRPAGGLGFWIMNLVGAILIRLQWNWFIGNSAAYTIRKISNPLLLIIFLLFALRIFFTFRLEKII